MAQLIKHRTATVDTWKTVEIVDGETPENVQLPTGDVIFPIDLPAGPAAPSVAVRWPA